MIYQMKSRPVPVDRYAIQAAEDAGRLAGYNHCIALGKWPLATAPVNPFPAGPKASAWESKFRETVSKHRPKTQKPT